MASAQQQGATELVRTAYRNAENAENAEDPENPEAPSTGPGEPEITAALLCRDHLVGSLDDRSKRILIGLLAGRTQADLAAAEGISASAVSQRIRRDGIALILAAHTQLKEVR